MSNLGAKIHSIYMEPSSDQFVGLEDDGIRGFSARSSNLYRSLVSSRAFINKLFPNETTATIPTLVFDRMENDWKIRGYNLCPKLNQKFEEFLKSDEFENKRKEKPEGESETNEEFVVRLSKNFAKYDSFPNVWSVYDLYLIIENNCYGHDRPQPPPESNREPPCPDGVDKLLPKEFDRLKDLADWYETSKYDFATHNIHVAGGLLRTIMRKARQKIDKSPDGRQAPNILEYSAHYPTLLSLFASLRAKNPERKQFPADEIPGFGAALVFELSRDENEDYIMKLRWWKGDGNWEEEEENDVDFENFAIGREPCTDKDGGCKFAEMERMLPIDDWGSDAFCGDCESSIDLCKAESRCETGTKVAAGGIGAVAGLILGMLLALGYLTFNARRKRRGLNMVDDPFEAESDFNGDVGA